MTVCFFGAYDPAYVRTEVLRVGLRRAGIKIIECNVRDPSIRKYFKLFRKHQKIRNAYDIMLVGFPGQHLMWFARLLSRAPIVFDAYLSLYEAEVEDRARVRSGSLWSWYYYFLDWYSVRLADKVLVDTEAHIRYFAEMFHISSGRFARVFVGAEDTVYYPRKKRGAPGHAQFEVLFFGSFIPFHGVEHIVTAARRFASDPSIRFTLIGRGQTFSHLSRLAQGIPPRTLRILAPMSREALAGYVAEADVLLGVFGEGAKGERVIPAKVFVALAVGKALISRSARAMHELLDPGVHYLAVPPADPEALVQALNHLRRHIPVRHSLGENARRLYLDRLIPEMAVRPLLTVLLSLHRATS